MIDFMFRAIDEGAWQGFASSLPPSEIDVIGEIGDDNRYHVNVRVLVDIQKETINILKQGAEGVEWIDPSTVSTPNRTWFGRMHYA